MPVPEKSNCKLIKQTKPPAEDIQKNRKRLNDRLGQAISKRDKDKAYKKN